MARLHKESEDVEVEEQFSKEEEKEALPAEVVAKLKPELQERLRNWVPRTSLGRAVMSGEITRIEQVFERGLVIREPEIVDYLLPNLENELVMTGGMPGKGGGKMRTGVRITTRMHKSGRKRKLSALLIVGNRDGVLGLGYANGKDARTAIWKAEERAKLNVVVLRRGCGSWECACRQAHSIPFEVVGKSGSVRVKLMPAPRGLGIAANEEAKKLFKLAGIKDLWMKSFGETGTRLNFIMAILDALVKLNKIKVDEKVIESVGMRQGAAETIAPQIESAGEEKVEG